MVARFEVGSTRVVDTPEGIKKYVAYTLLVKRHEFDQAPVTIERRYTEFRLMYKSLCKEFPSIVSFIDFPRKVLAGNFRPNLIKKRSAKFERFMLLIVFNDMLRQSPAVEKFLIGKQKALAKEYLEVKAYGQAKPLLENIFLVLNKVHPSLYPPVIIALCRLVACCNSDPTSLRDAEKYAAVALRRFEAISDVDLLCYYVPLLKLCINLWWVLGRDKEALESKLNALKRRGHRVDGCPTLLEYMLKIA